MEKTKSRQIKACLLLSVFLPMMLLSSLHVHESELVVGSACSACVNHVPHAGHFLTDNGSMHDCLLCQFLSISYLTASSVLMAVLCIPVSTFSFYIHPNYQSLRWSVKLLRAPPVHSVV